MYILGREEEDRSELLVTIQKVTRYHGRRSVLSEGAGFYTFFFLSLFFSCPVDFIFISLVMTSDTLVIEDMEHVRVRVGHSLSAASQTWRPIRYLSV